MAISDFSQDPIVTIFNYHLTELPHLQRQRRRQRCEQRHIELPAKASLPRFGSDRAGQILQAKCVGKSGTDKVDRLREDVLRNSSERGARRQAVQTKEQHHRSGV